MMFPKKILLVGSLVGLLLLVGCLGSLQSCAKANVRRRSLSEYRAVTTEQQPPPSCANVEYELWMEMPDVLISLLAIKKSALAVDPSSSSNDNPGEAECADVYLMHDASVGVGKELLVMTSIGHRHDSFTTATGKQGDENEQDEEDDEDDEDAMLLIGESFTLQEIL